MLIIKNQLDQGYDNTRALDLAISQEKKKDFGIFEKLRKKVLFQKEKLQVITVLISDQITDLNYQFLIVILFLSFKIKIHLCRSVTSNLTTLPRIFFKKYIFLKKPKLLGKNFAPEPIEEFIIKPKAENSYSQSTIEDNKPQQLFIPKQRQGQRIHFQSLQNIPGLELRDGQPKKHELKPEFQFKENIRKKSLRIQVPETLSIEEIKFRSNNEAFNQNNENLNNFNVENSSSCLETEEELILRKTRLILKSTLKNKISESEICYILNSLQTDIENSTQFDKLVSSSSIETNETQVLTKPKKSIEQTKKVVRVKSMDRLRQMNQKAKEKRVKSCEKVEEKKLTKKQQKKRAQEAKQQILKSIKKVKQLVFLNEKSLKRTRRV